MSSPYLPMVNSGIGYCSCGKQYIEPDGPCHWYYEGREIKEEREMDAAEDEFHWREAENGY